MNPGNASADGGENLVRDCVCPGGHLVGGDRHVALTADENNFISLLYSVYIGNVDGSQIHAYSSRYRRAATMDQHRGAIGKNALVTVCITHGEGGDQALPAGDEGPAIAKTCAFGHSLQLKHSGLPAEHRPEFDPV